MTVSHIPLTCKEALGLRCPYTGRPYKVMMHVCDGIVTYSVPDAFSLAKFRSSLKALLDDASMRDGIKGTVRDDTNIIDAFTGETLELEKDGGKFRFANAFDPTVASMDLADFLRKLSCGKVDMAAPKAESIEHPGSMGDQNDRPSQDAKVQASADETAEKIVNAVPGANRGRTRVSMFFGRGKGRGPAK